MVANPTPDDSATPSNAETAGVAFIDDDFVMRDTVDVLSQTLKALGKAGRPVEASRLAAQAWHVLRRPHPKEAERINTLMHYLARLPDEVDPHQEQPGAGNTERELDIRSLPHGERHAVIFATHGALEPGEGFVLVNDHDPRPLRYQFEAEHSGQFTWDYVEQGPRVWRVRIGRPATH
jgi:uncharacterized protein (DUF2249 family)